MSDMMNENNGCAENCGGNCTCCGKADPRLEAMSIMHYLSIHNASYVRELHKICAKLRDRGDAAGCDFVMQTADAVEAHCACLKERLAELEQIAK